MFSVITSPYLSSSFHRKLEIQKQRDRKCPVFKAFQSLNVRILLFKLGKSKDILKYICLGFVSFLPLFYLCCIYYFGLLIFCCQFVASFIITDAKMLYNLYFENTASFLESRYTQYWFMLIPSRWECSASDLCRLRGILNLNCPE